MSGPDTGYFGPDPSRSGTVDRPEPSSMKLLIADDHALVRRGLKTLLQTIDPGLEVLEADSFPEVLEHMVRNDDISLVLLDLVLPGTNGLDGLRLVREQYPDVAVLIVSMSEDPTDIRDALALGAVGYVPKSTGDAVLAGAIRLVLAGGTYLPPQVLDGARPLSSAGSEPTPAGLTDRQRAILDLLSTGASNKRIASRLGLAEQTVKNNVTVLLRHLGAANRTEAVALARMRRQP